MIKIYYRYGYHPCPFYAYEPIRNLSLTRQSPEPITDVTSNTTLKDYGPEPFVIDIEEATTQNNMFRTTLWTGENFQLTLMSIDIGEEIGLESHPELDQFLRIEDGKGLVQMGSTKDNLDFQRPVEDDYIIIVPAGKWHNLINTGDKPLKLYSIYAPPEHPYGTVHGTKAISDATEAEHEHY